MRRLVFVMGVLMFLSLVASARAGLYVSAHQAGRKQVVDPSRFRAIIGYQNQCVAGIRCWVYVKGSRSPDAGFPEKWYLHADGVRVRDGIFNLYVMDVRSPGWEQHVAETCPHYCFVDGLGHSSIGRTVPQISWTPAQWVSRSALVVRAVTLAGKIPLPNSVGSSPAQGAALVAAAGGRGSTEGFTPENAAVTLGLGHIWVSEIGGCVAKYAAFLEYRGRRDRFACYEAGHDPWDLSWLN